MLAAVDKVNGTTGSRKMDSCGETGDASADDENGVRIERSHSDVKIRKMEGKIAIKGIPKNAIEKELLNLKHEGRSRSC